MMNRRLRFNFRKKKKKDEIDLTPLATKDDLTRVEQGMGNKLEEVERLAKLTPRQKLRMMKQQIHAARKPRRV